ncbi:MAG: hypothetical protein IH604_04660 [Burkholderiales bacterium]|nr:hypothetical protein [Burkholderiales bacterium]
MKNAPKIGLPPPLDETRPSMADALRTGFPLFLNEENLRSAIESVCADFGMLTYLHILPAMRGTSFHCACSIKLDSEAAHAALKSKFQVMEHAGELHFMAEVDERWTGRTL